jgi:glycosyltransferase involved in cell wall biosynthesis
MKQLNLDEKDFIVVDPGEFTRLGFVDDLVKMVLKYADILRKNNIKIIFAYRIKNEKDAIKKKEILETFKKNNAMDIVRLPDTFTSMEKVFNLADICLFPVNNMKGKFDIPLTVVEAMACKKPVILSDLPILKELTNDETSVIIPRGNIDALAEAIFDLKNNPEKRMSIGQEGRKFVEENFDIKNVAEIYKKIYEVL